MNPKYFTDWTRNVCRCGRVCALFLCVECATKLHESNKFNHHKFTKSKSKAKK